MGLAQANNAPVEREKTEMDRLRMAHELFTFMAPEYDLFLSAYEGGRDMLTANHLFRHPRENIEDFQERLKRAHYVNYIDQIVSYFSNYIFSETIDRDGADNSGFTDEFLPNVDRRGNDIDAFMKTVSDDMQIFGMTYTLVDAPKGDPNIDPSSITKQYEKDNGIRPYWVLIKAIEIVDWVVNDFDEFDYLKRRQVVNEISGGVISSIEKYTEWYRDRVEVSRIDVTDSAKPKLLAKEVIPSDLTYVPVVVTRYGRSKRHPHLGVSFIRDLAYNNREIFNLTSLEQDYLYRQAFNILAVQTESNIPLAEQQDGEFGTANRMEYPKGADAPSYVSPPSGPAEHIAKTIQRIKSEMFARASQDTLNELFNGEGSSGFSQAQAFSKTVPFIASRADILEKTEVALMVMTLDRTSKTWNGKVKYKDRYEITNINDALTHLQQLARDLMLPSETFIKESLKRLVHEFDNKMPPDMLRVVEDQIDSMDFDAWQETQKEALVGKSNQGNSPGAQQKPKQAGTTTAQAKAESNKQKIPGASKKVKT